MTTATGTDTALADRAAEAWAMLSRADDPMPPFAALDYVQEVNDDRRACFAALCAAGCPDLEVAFAAALRRRKSPRRDFNFIAQCLSEFGRGKLGDLPILGRIFDTHAGHNCLWNECRTAFGPTLSLFRALEAAL